MSNTENLGLKIPTLAEKNIHTTYVNNNDIIDNAYGQYLEDKETAQENIAMIETPVAQSNHTTGSYFMLDNVLHKATSNIASGEDIVSGSNATPITIEQALSALNSSVGNLQDSVTKTQIAIYQNFQSSTTLVYTGISFVIPPNSIYGCRIDAVYVNNAPKELVVSASSDPSTTYEYLDRSTDSALGTGASRCYITGATYSNPITVYVHAKYNGAQTNRINVAGWSMPI